MFILQFKKLEYLKITQNIGHKFTIQSKQLEIVISNSHQTNPFCINAVFLAHYFIIKLCIEIYNISFVVIRGFKLRCGKFVTCGVKIHKFWCIY